MKVELAAPNQFITLTCWTKAYLGPRNAYDRMRPQVAELAKVIRRNDPSWQYCKVLEAHANGFPHWHLMSRGKYIPQKWLSQQWDRLAQSPIVHIQAVEEIQSVYAYTVGYLTKQVSVPFTQRRMSWSRGFFPKTTDEESVGWQCEKSQREDLPPADLALSRLRGRILTQVTNSAWQIELLPGEDYSRPKFIRTGGKVGNRPRIKRPPPKGSAS